MIDRSKLFTEGFLTQKAGLSDILDAQRRHFVSQISGLREIDQSTLPTILEKATISPLTILRDQAKRRPPRTETIRVAEFGNVIAYSERMFVRGVDMSDEDAKFSCQVIRILLPFTGDPHLFRFTPSEGWGFPRGFIEGNCIVFDVEDFGDGRLNSMIRENIDLIEKYVARSHADVVAFNNTLPDSLKRACDERRAELEKQKAALDALGIPEEPEPTVFQKILVSRPGPKRSRASSPTVTNIYTDSFNQHNYNDGDVNNAIQSSEPE